MTLKRSKKTPDRSESTRQERLKASLKANMAKRKAQIQARTRLHAGKDESKG